MHADHGHGHHHPAHQWTLHGGSLGPQPVEHLTRSAKAAAAVAGARARHLSGSPPPRPLHALRAWLHALAPTRSPGQSGAPAS